MEYVTLIVYPTVYIKLQDHMLHDQVTCMEYVTLICLSYCVYQVT